MCNSKNHRPGCTCGFGGYGHLGRRGTSYASQFYTSPVISPPRDLFLDRYPEFSKATRVSACFVNPNATCPVCGESIFYYQNERGSRVFFDELGPPWPKHRCTDTRSAGTQSVTTFSIRGQAAIADISKWQKDRGIDFVAEFKTKYGTSPWSLATIVIREKRGKQVFVTLAFLKKGRAANVYFSCKALPKCCETGFPVAVSKQKISFFDTSEFVPMEVVIKRYRGATAFFHAMVEQGTENT